MTKKQSSALRDIDAPHYRYWQAVYYCFFSRTLYVDVGKRWRGLSVLYLLLLMFVVTIPFSVRIIIQFDNFFNQEIIIPLKKLPTIMVQNGLVSLDKPMPYFVKNDTGEVIAIVDTTGKITEITNKYPDLSILITKDSLIYRVPNPPHFFNLHQQKEWPTTTQQFSKEMNQIFDSYAWVESSGLSTIKGVVEVMIYPMMAFLFFALYLVFLLAFALMAQFVAQILMKCNLTYLQSFRILTVSATPHIFTLLLALAFNQLFVGLGALLSILLAGYFSFAVLSLKRESNKLVNT